MIIDKWHAPIREAFERTMFAATELQLVTTSPRIFIERAELRISQGGPDKRWLGGTTNTQNGVSPVVYASTCARYTDKAAYLEFLAPGGNAHTYRKQVWAEAAQIAATGAWPHVEYYRICRDPDIGMFTSDDPLDHINAAMCHEVAHAVQHWEKHYQWGKSHGTDWSPHGTFWRETYRALRNELFNPWRNVEQLAANEEK